MTMYSHLLTVFPLLLLFTLPGECIINIEVQLESYSLGPSYRRNFSSCVDVSGQCSYGFHFCLRPRNRLGDCRYGEVTTNNVTTNDSFLFTPEVLSELGIMNPLVFPNFTPQSEVKLDITVNEHGQFLDKMSVTFFQSKTITTQFSRTFSFTGSDRRALIRLSYRITSNCSNDTYGPTCDIICRSSRTYYCNYLGVRVCKTGYYPPGVCSQYCYTSSCSRPTGGVPNIVIVLVSAFVGLILLIGCIACVCCIFACTGGLRRKKLFCSEKDCKDEQDQCCCYYYFGWFVWLLLLPISLPYCLIIVFCWNCLLCDHAEQGTERYINPVPCVADFRY